VTRLPLDDVRVIDLSVARAGPACVRQLADWGAVVIRVEPPVHVGDPSAVLGTRHGSDYQNLHRNKRSITIDLKRVEGRDLLLHLVDTADVVVENMRPPVKERLGFDYDTLRARNPRIVLGSISGFGQSGPYAPRGAVDQITQGMSGLMSVTGQPGAGPLRVGIPVSDLAAGLYLAIGILVALHDRARTGTGTWVQTSLLEAMVAMMDFQATRYTIDGVVPGQEGNDHPTIAPMGCFATADGYLNVGGASGRLLEAFCAVIGAPEILDDPRFDSIATRAANRAELNAIVETRLRTRTTAEWVEAFSAVAVPAGPVYSMDEVFADPQVAHLALPATVTHPLLGDLALVRNPVSIEPGIDTVRDPSPEAGQHTDEILRELGFTDAAIDDLHARRVV
jgi:crotonobetainyl-CoA:carnitine CoA-transferase CaiB-like acyl-CoA transferase